MESDYTTNSRYITHTIAFWKVGRIHFLSSGVNGLTNERQSYENSALNSSFCAVTADSKSRWPHGRRAYCRGVGRWFVDVPRYQTRRFSRRVRGRRTSWRSAPSRSRPRSPPGPWEWPPGSPQNSGWRTAPAPRKSARIKREREMPTAVNISYSNYVNSLEGFASSIQVSLSTPSA